MIFQQIWPTWVAAVMTNLLLGARLGLLAGFLLAAIFTDTTARKIPNRLIVAGIISGLLCQALLPGGDGLIAAFKGIGLGFVLFFPMYLLRVMGAGDVKLMAMVGGFTGSPDIIGIALFTLVAGGVLSLLFALKMKLTRQLLENIRLLILIGMTKAAAGKMPANDFAIKSVGTLPYAWAISMGTAGYLTWSMY